MYTVPFWLVMSTVWCYWLSVVVMIVRSRWRFAAASGALPRMGRERGMWLVWVPTIIGWQFLPGLAYSSTAWPLQMPHWADNAYYAWWTWLAVPLAFLAYALTVPCWLTLGANWSLAIVPTKSTGLITYGFYSRVRHPIYSLGLLLMAATVLVAPSPAMLLVAVTHIVLVMMKVSSEERFLIARHGAAYQEYCQRTGRFFPWLKTIRRQPAGT